MVWGNSKVQGLRCVTVTQRDASVAGIPTILRYCVLLRVGGMKCFRPTPYCAILRDLSFVANL